MFKLSKKLFYVIWGVFLLFIVLLWNGIITFSNEKAPYLTFFVFGGALWVAYSFSWVRRHKLESVNQVNKVVSNIVWLILSIIFTILGGFLVSMPIALIILEEGSQDDYISSFYFLIIGIIVFLIGMKNTLKYLRQIRKKAD